MLKPSWMVRTVVFKHFSFQSETKIKIPCLESKLATLGQSSDTIPKKMATFFLQTLEFPENPCLENTIKSHLMESLFRRVTHELRMPQWWKLESSFPSFAQNSMEFSLLSQPDTPCSEPNSREKAVKKKLSIIKLNKIRLFRELQKHIVLLLQVIKSNKLHRKTKNW